MLRLFAVRFVMLVCGVVVLQVVVASSASASSPWFSLTSGARPSYLRSGTAANEVQKVTVTGATEGKFTLANMSEQEVKEATEGAGSFECENFEPKYTEQPFNATPQQVQEGLEGVCGYGPGNVEVKGSVGDYEIAFKGTLAEQPVRLINTEIPGEPTNINGTISASEIKAGHSDGEIYFTAENLGDAVANGAKTPLKIKDMLPPGLHAVGIVAAKPFLDVEAISISEALPCSLETLSCEMKGELPPFDQIEVRIAVDVDPSAKSGELNQASVSGGGVQATSVSRPITIKGDPPPFGVENYALTNEEEGGAKTTQAGAHPFQTTTTITLNQNADTNSLINGRNRPEVSPAGLAKDISFRWPAGLIGNPNPFARCTDTQFNTTPEDLELVNACPPQTVVGVAAVTIQEPGLLNVNTFTVPLFNMEPGRGEPARFGFIIEVANVPVFIDTAVRTGSDYGITITSSNITQVSGFLAAKVTVWGVPGDARHDDARGWGCLAATRRVEGQGSCNPVDEQHPPAFLSLPTSCTGPLHSTALGDSWSNQSPENVFPVLASYTMPALDGCNRLPFSPSIKVTPDTNTASSPSGVNVDIHVPQAESLNANGLSEAAPRDITVALPEGVAINPSSGDGLQACSEGLAGFTGFGELVPSGKTALFTEHLPSPLAPGTNFCPNASKIGTVRIKTPILPDPIEGAVYLATQNQNPFGSLLALYLIAEDPASGVLIKLTGETRLTGSGQIVTTFRDSPQAPFEDAELHFFGGERAPLATPARCGAYTTAASIAPWSGNPPANVSSTFDIASGPNGTPCPGATLPFSPSLTAGTTNVNAGGFSPLTTTVGRGDGQQDMRSVSLHMPPGLSGILTGIPLCSEVDANAGSCPEASRIGETTVAAGVGGDPVSVKGGKVYLTEKYDGAPFGLAIVNPVKAGPVDLEHDTSSPSNQPACDCLVVRAKIEVDPHTAALTVTTDPSGPHAIPSMVDGVPVQIQKVNVTIDRPGFTFNPTNCSPLSITGAISAHEGGLQPLSVPFQATNCASLKFTPKFSVSTSAKTSKANGASLTVKLSEPNEPLGSQANIAKVKVELPKQLPSRLTTLQKACTNAQFEANPAGCPAASNIGHAKVTTPLLPVPLEGPAIFVSHGGEAFPSLTMVLQGYGVKVDLVGTTFISKAGVTSTTFKTIPDVPFNNFELTLPTGKYSALTALGNVCTEKLTMPTEFIAQNGAMLKRNTPVSVTGCAKKKALTRAQKLAAALKVCHKKHNYAKRARCERQARHRYTAKKATAKKEK